MQSRAQTARVISASHRLLRLVASRTKERLLGRKCARSGQHILPTLYKLPIIVTSASLGLSCQPAPSKAIGLCLHPARTAPQRPRPRLSVWKLLVPVPYLVALTTTTSARDIVARIAPSCISSSATFSISREAVDGSPQPAQHPHKRCRAAACV